MEQVKQIQSNKKTDAGAYNQALKNFLGNYVLRAVHAFMEHQDFDASPVWIANKLNISIETAAQALDNLVILGLAERTSEGFLPKEVKFLIPDDEMTPEVRMDRHTLVSLQILNRLDPRKRTFYYQGFVASNKEAFTELKTKLNKLLSDFSLQSAHGPKDGLYCFTTTAVDIMENDQEKEGNP